MTKNPERRLGSADEGDIRRHRFFAHMDWEALAERKVKPQFVPEINDQPGVGKRPHHTTYWCPNGSTITYIVYKLLNLKMMSRKYFTNNIFSCNFRIKNVYNEIQWGL